MGCPCVAFVASMKRIETIETFQTDSLETSRVRTEYLRPKDNRMFLASAVRPRSEDCHVRGSRIGMLHVVSCRQ